MSKPTVAIVGASADRSKYGNKSVRAHLAQGYDVFPVNPKGEPIEGLKTYRTISEIPVALNRVSLYLAPDEGLKVIEEIARKGTRELFLNPGAESDALVAKAAELGLSPMVACSIVNLGASPSQF